MSKTSSLIVTLLLLIFVHSQQECCNKNVFMIVGAGVTEVDPDVAVFYISAYANGNTSLQALSNVNTIIAQTQTLIYSLNLPDVNVTTSYIYLYPVYNYTNGTSYIVGQQASEGLRVVVGNLNASAEILGNLATNLSTVNNISISGFSFQSSNPNSAFKVARAAAVADAQSKLEQYALLSGKNAKRCVVNIVDQNVDRYVPFDISPGFYAFKSMLLEIPYGKVQVYANVQIKWKFHG